MSSVFPDDLPANQETVIEVYDNDTQAFLGTITEPQLQFLIDYLEEESSDDQDYYINGATLDMFAKLEADPALLAFLQRGLAEREAMEIRWVRSDRIGDAQK